MSITLELPKELQTELAVEASQLGLSLPEYILRLLSTATLKEGKPKSGVELIEYWRTQGLIGTRSDITDGPAHARQIRVKVERRPRI